MGIVGTPTPHIDPFVRGYIPLGNKPHLQSVYYKFRPFTFSYQRVSIMIRYRETMLLIIKAIMRY